MRTSDEVKVQMAKDFLLSSNEFGQAAALVGIGMETVLSLLEMGNIKEAKEGLKLATDTLAENLNDWTEMFVDLTNIFEVEVVGIVDKILASPVNFGALGRTILEMIVETEDAPEGLREACREALKKF